LLLLLKYNMIDALQVSLKKGISIVEIEDAIVLESIQVRLRIASLSPGVKAAIRLLASPAASESELCEVAEQVDRDFMSGCRLIYYLRELRLAGLLQYSLRSGAKFLATIDCADDRSLVPLEIPSDRQLVLSRFAYLRKRDGEAALESALSHTRIIVQDPVCFDVIFSLIQPRNFEELFADGRASSQDELRIFIELLYGLAFVRKIGDEEEGDYRYWEFHDLIFQARTRLWRRDDPTGATFRFGLKSPPIPALKAPMSTQSFKLFRPDIELLIQNDRPFTGVLEERKSVRANSQQVISANQIGEFLYRFARVRLPTGLAGREGGDATPARLYPNGGSCYELELYLLIEQCEGIPRGLYHYRPDRHELSKLSTETSYLGRIVQEAKLAAPGTDPQAIAILTARFARIFWKYEGIAYSLILQNVGVLLQTMYLVATAMRLMPCAIGAVNSSLFARATGIDTLTEASVGEFVLNGTG
jgi:oxazoline/thiazoline dehydrogenase